VRARLEDRAHALARHEHLRRRLRHGPLFHTAVWHNVALTRNREVVGQPCNLGESQAGFQLHFVLGNYRSGFDFDERPLPPSSDDLAAAWGPYMRECMETFSPRRCMFESNFPVDKGSVSYPVLWNAFKKIAGDCSPDERLDLFFRTANTTYGLELESLPGRAGTFERV